LLFGSITLLFVGSVDGTGSAGAAGAADSAGAGSAGAADYARSNLILQGAGRRGGAPAHE
jgi:hypothetical protein